MKNKQITSFRLCENILGVFTKCQTVKKGDHFEHRFLIKAYCDQTIKKRLIKFGFSEQAAKALIKAFRNNELEFSISGPANDFTIVLNDQEKKLAQKKRRAI